MNEYRIMKQVGNTKPREFKTFRTFEECYFELIRLIDLEKQLNRKYYVLNDFYKNQYTLFERILIKFSIEEREVETWEVYEQNKNKCNKLVTFKPAR